MTNEMVLWGLPKGETDALYQVVLLTNGTHEKIARVKVLAARDGFHSFRVQHLDGSVPEFTQTITGTKRG
jgi:hypothetical protein